MASTVKVPLLGTHKKGTVIGVAIGGTVIAGYMIYKYKKDATAEASDQTDGEDTGYGDTGDGQADYSGAYGDGGGSYYTGGGGGGYPWPPWPAPPGGGDTAITTNAQWTQKSLKDLKADGYQTRPVLDALGKYIYGVGVNDAETSIIRAAIALEGYPPVEGANGYPPKIKQGGGGGDGQGGRQVTVPDVTGKLYPAAAVIIKQHHLVPKRGSSFVGKVVREQPTAGSRVAAGSTVRLSGVQETRIL
jgi:hypothetical protein